MKVLDRIPSRERCAEAGWYAWDLLLERPMDDAFIRSLRPLGGFVYLSMLSKPFFKIESACCFIKGLRGDDFMRVAVHNDHRDKLEAVEAFLSRLP